MADKNFKVKNGLDVAETVTAATFSGSGASLTNIPVSGLAGGSATAGEALVYNGTNWVDANATAIATGSPTLGSLDGNGTMPSITSSNSISDNVSLLSKSVGALLTNAGVTAPANFPAGSLAATITTSSAFLIANGYSPPTNGNTGITTTAGTAVNRITSANPTITMSGGNTAELYSGGPGDSGILTMSVNGLTGSTYTLTTGHTSSGTPDSGAKTGTTSGGVQTSFTIANNVPFPSAALAGFFETFRISAMSVTGLPAGFNRISLAHSGAGTLNVSPTNIFYDNQTGPTPTLSFSSVTVPASPTLSRRSAIPYYSGTNNFTLNYSVSNISGNLYASSPSLSAVSSTPFATITAKSTWATVSSSISTPISANDTTSYSGSFTTITTPTTGAGSSTSRPTFTFSNGYNTTSTITTTALSGWSGQTIQWKNGNFSGIDETNVTVTASSQLGTSSSPASRIILNAGNLSGTTGVDNPVTSIANDTVYAADSTTSLSDGEAINMLSGTSGVIKFDQTNWSTGYLPTGGPNYSTRSGTSQYYTIRVAAANASGCTITYTCTSGGIAGLWVACPASNMDTSNPTTNGWMALTSATAGTGSNIVGTVNAGGLTATGNNFAATGTVFTPNSGTGQTITATFLGARSLNFIYVRIKLTGSQTLTGLSIS